MSARDRESVVHCMTGGIESGCLRLGAVVFEIFFAAAGYGWGVGEVGEEAEVLEFVAEVGVGGGGGGVV